MSVLRDTHPSLYKVALLSLIHLCLGIVFLALFTCAYWLWWPTIPLAVPVDDYAVTPVVRPGGTLVIHRGFRVAREGVALIYREIIQQDGKAVFVLPSVTRHYHPGTYSIDSYIQLAELPVGRYNYVAGVTYDENPLRTITLPSIVVQFEIRQPIS